MRHIRRAVRAAEEDVPVLVLARVQAAAERDAVKKTPLENLTTFPNPYNKAPLLCKGAFVIGIIDCFQKTNSEA